MLFRLAMVITDFLFPLIESVLFSISWLILRIYSIIRINYKKSVCSYSGYWKTAAVPAWPHVSVISTFFPEAQYILVIQHILGHEWCHSFDFKRKTFCIPSPAPFCNLAHAIMFVAAIVLCVCENIENVASKHSADWFKCSHSRIAINCRNIFEKESNCNWDCFVCILLQKCKINNKSLLSK